MAMGSAEDKVAAFLEEERNEVVLPTVLVALLKDYLLGTLAVREVPKDLPDTIEAWVESAAEAFEEANGSGAALPAAFANRLKRWLSGTTAKKGGAGSPPPKTGGGALGPLALVAAELNVTPAAIQDDFDEL